MEKKAMISLVITVLLIGFPLSQANAAKSEDEIQAEKRKEIREKVEQKKTELNGTSWDVNIQSQGGKGLFDGPDQLVFQDGMFQSKKSGKKGYTPTNYTITVQEEGPTIWETMQTSSDDGVVFWRGEWKKDSMSGVINRQMKEGSEDYYFSSSTMNKISPTSEKDSSSEEAEAESSNERMLSSVDDEAEAPPAPTKKAGNVAKSRMI